MGKKKFDSKALQLLNIYFRNTLVTPSFPLISKASLASSKNKSWEFFSPIDTTSFQSNRGGDFFSSDFLLPSSNFRSKEFSKDDGKIMAGKSWEENDVRRAKRYSALSRDQIRRFSSSSMAHEWNRVPLRADSWYLNSIAFPPSDPRFRRMSRMNQFSITYNLTLQILILLMKLLIKIKLH